MTASGAALSLALIGPLAACSSSTSTGTAATPVQETQAITKVDPATAESLVKQGVTVLDVRTPEEYATGHIAGAVNVNWEGTDFASQVKQLDPAKPVLVYCHSGNRSGQAVQVMEQEGFQRIFDLGGGVLAWNAAGQPLTTS
jgi:rhodanese-related sulfurtransferase